MIIGYHASHEQFSPIQLLEYITLAQQAGFQAVMSSDHSAPWSENQGQSGFSWSWLGAAMQKISLPFGTLCIPIDYRYHPLLVAQASATIVNMFPERMSWIAVGSGEALNEIMVGKGWPEKEERNSRLFEGTNMIRRLWNGESVTEDKGFIKAHQARLWTLPADQPDAKHFPALLGAALTPETAKWMAPWVDGLITVRMPNKEMQHMLNLFQKNGGKGKKLVLQMQIAWAPNEEDALTMAFDQWKMVAIPSTDKANMRTPNDFDQATKNLIPDNIKDKILISSQADIFIEAIQSYQEMGFDEIYLHNACLNQAEFIDFFGKQVLPYFNSTQKA